MSSPSSAPLSPPSSRFGEFLPLIWLALGTFATGTESFMIAPLLPRLADDLSVSVMVAGQLVTVFALTYALSSPVLSALSSGIGRRNLLLGSMAAFALANFIASTATSYWQLMGARILLACAAGLYVPSASALAGAVVSPARRGTALAIVNGGTSSAVALGVPLGAVIGNVFGWRMTFVGVGILACLAFIGLFVGLPRNVGAGIAAPSIRERLAVAGQRRVLLALLVTTLWATGAYTVYPYLGVYLAQVVGIEGTHVGLVFFVWGTSAVAGLFIGGAINDRFGARAALIPSFALLILAYLGLSACAIFLPVDHARGPVLAAVVLWGLTGWGFYPAQQALIMRYAGVKVASIALSLNASFMYLGFSLGALLGSFALIHGSVASLGWVGALCEIAALLAVLVTTRDANTAAAPVPLGPNR